MNANRVKPAVDELCASDWSCQVLSSISELWILIAISLITVVIAACLANLDEALAVVDEEQSRTSVEQEAFLDFATRLAEIHVTQQTSPQGMSTGGTVSLAAGTPSSHALDDVKTAYRETVMDVEHYDEEYGEPLAVNMAAELGEEIATYVTEGTEFSPMLQQALITKSEHAASDRGRLINSLEREAGSLADAKEEFQDIGLKADTAHETISLNSSFRQLQETWGTLGELERRCSEFLQNRQNEIQSEILDNGSQRHEITFSEYLYGPLDTDYPILSTGTEILEILGQYRRHVLLQLTSRV